MTRTVVRIITIIIFIFCALGIGALVLFPNPWNAGTDSAGMRPRIVIPREMQPGDAENPAEDLARENSMSAWADLEKGEAIVAILSGYFDGGPAEQQFIAYRNLLEMESPIYLTFIDYDETSRAYKRVWSAPTAATRPGTISIHTQDLLGDRSVCVLLYGMNASNEHTLTVFRMKETSASAPPDEHFSKIAELRIDGTITVRETERASAYHNGQSRGASFNISAFGRDFDSSNILDQVETIYAYNDGGGLYEQRNTIRIPGSQVEQRRVRELLGNPAVFEDFISGLWYHVTPEGAINKQQFIYFNPADKEIIFFGDETQQVFNWQNSTATRYGLYVSSQNISVTTLRRSIDIELESLDGIRVRVIEGVRLKIRVSAPWDGSYKKAGPLESGVEKLPASVAHIEARYDSSIGKMYFKESGSYEINSGTSLTEGKYAFFNVNGEEMLELRPNGASAAQREMFLITEDESEGEKAFPANTLTLFRARLGAGGVEKTNEEAVLLTLVSE